MSVRALPIGVAIGSGRQGHQTAAIINAVGVPPELARCADSAGIRDAAASAAYGIVPTRSQAKADLPGQHADAPPGATRAEWAERIKGHWAASLESVMAVGRDLMAAKEALDHGEFIDMVERDLPFARETAFRLMKVSRDPRLANDAHVQHLPNSWGTLYELTKIKDDQVFEAAVADGRIRPDMERKDAALLRTAERRETRLARNEALATAAPPLKSLADDAGQRYPVVYADPPWEFKTYSLAGREKSPDQHYPVMSLDAIAALPVGEGAVRAALGRARREANAVRASN